MRTTHIALLSLIAMGYSNVAYAKICDYRPSEFVVGATTAAGVAVGASGTALKSAGFYTLVHSITGSTMLASTAGGASGAGTVGIMGGTGGGIGAVAGFLMAPEVIAAGAVVAVGGAGLESVCYLTGSPTEQHDFENVLGNVVLISWQLKSPNFVVEVPGSSETAQLVVGGAGPTAIRINISDLYLDEGRLMMKGILVDTELIDTRIIWDEAAQN
jgi:hypothetical protein